MSTELQERISRLPKWAQSHIGVLERDNKSFRDRDEAMETGDTNTWREDIFPEPDIALPPDSQIIFLCKNEDGRIVSIKARAHDDCVQIHSPHGQIMITPSSSNWIKVQVSD